MIIEELLAIIPKIRAKHIIKGDEFDSAEIFGLVNLALNIKRHKLLYSNLLYGKTIAMIFNKPSLRTRFSFATGIQAAGGYTVESSFSQSHEGKEAIKDTIRVIEGYCDALVLRAHEEQMFDEFIEYSSIPIINGLSENFHPCQILADFLTIKEHFGTLDGIKLCYVGIGNNVLQSMMLLAELAGITLHYSCPQAHQPKTKETMSTLMKFDASAINATVKTDNSACKNTVFAKGKVVAFDNPQDAVRGCHVLYTDVWTSMGFESLDETDFFAFQANESLMEIMDSSAVFMHCMPLIRGKEVSRTLADGNRSIIFSQSHNRMYMQLAILLAMFNSHSTVRGQ